MSKQIIPREIQSQLDEAGISLAIGDQFIDNSNYIITITGFEQKDGRDFVLLNHSKWDTERKSLKDFTKNVHDMTYARITGSLAEAEAEAIKAMQNPDLIDPDGIKPDEQNTALAVGSASLNNLKKAQSHAEMVQHRATSMMRLIERKTAAMRAMAYQMRERLSYLHKVIGFLEAYTGIYQEVHQLREGIPASPDTPITIRQLVLYMDEEVGCTEMRANGPGIDYESVEDFDAWLLTGDNYRYIVPEDKCIVALKPSRQNREAYIEEWWKFGKQQNKFTYLIIRNGEQLSRIWTNIAFSNDLLYPTIEEWAKVIEKIEQAGNHESSQLKAKGAQLTWLEHIAILQGLLDRTQLLQPVAHFVNLFDPMTYGNLINLIRDAEGVLPDGRVPYREWIKLNHSHTKRGSRVLLGPIKWDEGKSVSRWAGYYAHEVTTPPKPEPGIYKVAEAKQGKDTWTYYKILYNPGDVVYSRSWGDWEPPHERKKRVGYYLMNYDNFWLNYDHLSLDDVQFYISHRLERKNYLKMLPVLREIREQRLAEIEAEKQFVSLLANEMAISEAAIWQAIEWWKHKNIWQRPLAEDDAKAWRMIKKRLKKITAV